MFHFAKVGDEDWFSFSGVAGFQYEFKVAFSDLSGNELSLFDTDGSTRLEGVTFGSTANISWIAPESGTYYLSFKSTDTEDSGSYQLLGFSTIPSSSIEFGEVGYFTPGTVEFALRDATGFAAGATVLLETSSGDTETILVGPEGIDFSSSIATAPDSASPNDGILQVASGDTLMATYFDSDDGLGSTFTAIDSTVIYVDDHGDAALTATSLELPASVSGSIEVAGDQDWFSFNAVAGTTYRFDIPTHDEWVSLALFSTDGTTELAMAMIFQHPLILTYQRASLVPLRLMGMRIGFASIPLLAQHISLRFLPLTSSPS